MKKQYLTILLIVMFITINIFAHKPDVAYFSFQKKEGKIEIIAEMPWTFRNAILIENPKLGNSKSKKDFENAIFSYFKKNITIRENLDSLNLELVNKLDQEHSHSAVYQLIFTSENKFAELMVENTCLFEFNKNQTNKNTIITGKTKDVIFTSKDEPEFIFE